MAAQSDLYAVLGVAPVADALAIRAAYRSLARTNHPDAGGDERVMIRLNEAWHVLGNPVRRAYYDASQAAAAVAPAPPVHRDGSTVLDFGRFAGWSLKEIANEDEDYLDWFGRTPAGRPYQAEIKRVIIERTKLIESLRRPAPTRRFAWRTG
jgi:curved DNA-binding protein CbpA